MSASRRDRRSTMSRPRDSPSNRRTVCGRSRRRSSDRDVTTSLEFQACRPCSPRHLAEQLLNLFLELPDLGVDLLERPRRDVAVEVPGERDLVAELRLGVVDPGVAGRRAAPRPRCTRRRRGGRARSRAARSGRARRRRARRGAAAGRSRGRAAPGRARASPFPFARPAPRDRAPRAPPAAPSRAAFESAVVGSDVVASARR